MSSHESLFMVHLVTARLRSCFRIGKLAGAGACVQIASFLGLLLLTFFSSAQSQKCETTNAALQAMPPIKVVITRVDGSQLLINAKWASNNRTRAAGFQRVCESTMRETPILFTFDRELVPSFHMNNVVAPIDIAFIRSNNDIDVIHAMKPYSLMALKKPLYSSRRPIIAALETHKGFYQDNNIDLSSKISWHQPLDGKTKPGEHSNEHKANNK